MEKSNISKSIIEKSILLNDIDAIIWTSENNEYLEIVGATKCIEEWKGEEQQRNCVILKDKSERYYRILNSSKSNIRKYINYVANFMNDATGTRWKVSLVSMQDSRTESIRGEFYKWELLGKTEA